MRYIRLKNDNYILYLNAGMYNINNRTLNFSVIKDLIEQDAPEEEILPYLDLKIDPDYGVIEAYLDKKQNRVFYLQRKEQCPVVLVWLDDPHAATPNPENMANSNFLGVYQTPQGVKEDWPEFTI